MNIYGNKKLALLFLLPALLLLLLFVYYPIAESFVLSLYRWKAFSSERVYVGLEYYRKLFSDAVFYGRCPAPCRCRRRPSGSYE